jgi:sterol desaturase/sphingolipid hydroxylase (fatty acid hydroxylase superfamily)
MKINHLNLYVLFFGLFLFAVEIVVLKKLKQKTVNLNQCVLNIGLGMIERLLGIITFNFGLIYFNFLVPFRILELNFNPYISFIITLFAVDLMWYIYHRISHRVSIIWAAHLIHHQSIEYNFSVNFALSPLGFFVRIFIYGTLVLVGISPEDIITINAINAFYQYLLHSELWPRFKAWEIIFVTPKFHQIHHSSVREHLDTNYGGMFTIWDRMFGTFHVDSNVITYGITNSIQNNNPFHLQIFFFRKLLNNFRDHSLKRAIQLLFLGPEKQSPDMQKTKSTNTNYTFIKLISGFLIFSFGYTSISIGYLPIYISLFIGFIGIIIFSGIIKSKIK